MFFSRTNQGCVHPNFPIGRFSNSRKSVEENLVVGGGLVRFFESCNDDNDKENETLCDVTWQSGSHYDVI